MILIMHCILIYFPTRHFRALVRSGRLEEHITLSLPSVQQRRECLVALFDPEARDWLDRGSAGSGGDDAAVQRNKDVDAIAQYTELRYVRFLLFNPFTVFFARICSADASVVHTNNVVFVTVLLYYRSYAYLRALYQEANITFAREKVFAKLSQYTSSGSGSNGSAVDFSALVAEAGGPAEKVEFVCQYMLKRVKLF